jgi:EmrB/QacA subfamily drug resistance transporter
VSVNSPAAVPGAAGSLKPLVGTPTAAKDTARWLALGVIAIAQLMVVLDASIVNIALPSAQKALHISDASRQWVVTAYTLGFGGLLLLGGRISDYAGRKRMFIVGLLGFAAASALGGIAPNAGLLLAARGLQGAFAAVLAPASLSLLTVTFTDTRERAKAFGVYGAIAGGGAAIGLILGGILTEYTSWRWCLLVNVPIALLAALAATRYVRESRAEGNTKYDIPGAVLVTGGLVSLVYGFTKAEQDGWGSHVTIALIALGLVALVAFVFVEIRSTHPLLPMRVVLDRNRGGSFIAMFLVGVAMLSMFLFMTYYFQLILGYSALRSGFAFLPFSIGVIASAGMASAALPRVGPRPLMILGLVMAAGGMFWLSQVGTDTAWVTHVLPPEIVLSLGMGFVFVPLASVALIGVGGHDAGVASALVNTTQQVGGSLGTALLNTVAATATTSYVASHAVSRVPSMELMKSGAVHGFSIAFIWGGMSIVLALVAVLVLIRAGKDQVSAESLVHMG